MDAWELFFREKSKRRFARNSRKRVMKMAVLCLLLGGLAVAIFLQAMGLPR